MKKTNSSPKKKSAKKQLYESLSEKITHMLSDVTHTIADIPFKKMVKKAAKLITDTIHVGKKKAKKVKSTKKDAVPPAKQIKLQSSKPVKKSVKKVARKQGKRK